MYMYEIQDTKRLYLLVNQPIWCLCHGIAYFGATQKALPAAHQWKCCGEVCQAAVAACPQALSASWTAHHYIMQLHQQSYPSEGGLTSTHSVPRYSHIRCHFVFQALSVLFWVHVSLLKDKISLPTLQNVIRTIPRKRTLFIYTSTALMQSVFVSTGNNFDSTQVVVFLTTTWTAATCFLSVIRKHTFVQIIFN